MGALVALAALLFVAASGSAHRARPRILATPTITLATAPSRVVSGQRVKLSGTVSGEPVGATVQIYKSPYPYTTPTLMATVTTHSGGSYSASDVPDRSTKYRAVVVGTTAQANAAVGVIFRSVTKIKAEPLGRARVTIVVFHPSDLSWGGAKVHWGFGHGSRGRFKAAPATHTAKLSRSAIVLWTSVALPAGRYRWRACFHVPESAGFVNPGRPHGCTGLGFNGTGSLPNGYPGPAAVSRAAGYLSHRAGRLAFAVVDTEDRMSGVNIHWRFVSASVVKAMLLVAYLRRLHDRGQHYVDGYSNSFLYPMINVSDNNAATQCWSIVGDSGLYSVAHAAQMTDFSIVGIWANAQISAADQSKFFFEMDSIIPHEFVSYARRLLSTIAAYESWGIPAVARPRGYQVFFKGGWRTTGLGQLVHQVGRLEGHHQRFSIAVMTDGDPSMGYGIDTIQGVTSSLL